MEASTIAGLLDTKCDSVDCHHHHELRWISAIVYDKPELAREILQEDIHSSLSLCNFVCTNENVVKLIQTRSSITTSQYIPDKAWCMAAVFNSRKVLQVMREFDMPINQVNHHGNTFLHSVIAYASTHSEDMESNFVRNLAFMKSLLTEDEFKTVLLTENNDGLRPLELAAHLGTFMIFKFLFECEGVYMAKTLDLGFYVVQYFDITEYVEGERLFKSPAYTMMHLDNSKLGRKSTRDAFLEDPMATWFNYINYSNMPALLIWAFLRILFIISFLGTLLLTRNRSQHKLQCDLVNHSDSVNSVKSLGNNVYDALLVVFVAYDLGYLLFAVICYLVFSVVHLTLLKNMNWLMQNVSGKKTVVVYLKFYLFFQVLNLIGVLITCVLAVHVLLSGQSHDILSLKIMDTMVLIAVCASVWDVSYFLQLVPILNLYVIAVQRMLIDFVAFSVIFLLFFLSYSFGFYVLMDNSNDFVSSLYETFRLMLNMVSFSQSPHNLQFLHVAFIFMMVFVLLNMLIGIFTSSFEYVYKNKDVIMRVQSLSVMFLFEPLKIRWLKSLRLRLCKKHLVVENERMYVTKVVMKPFHTSYVPWQLWIKVFAMIMSCEKCQHRMVTFFYLLHYFYWNVYIRVICLCLLSMNSRLINSLTLEKYGNSLKRISNTCQWFYLFALLAKLLSDEFQRIPLFNIGSENGLVPSGNTALPEPLLTQIYVTIWGH